MKVLTESMQLTAFMVIALVEQATRMFMASEVPRPKVLGNFKKPMAERGHQNSDWRETRPGMDPDHLALIRKLPCCVPGCTLNPGGEAHHLKDTGAKERGMGLRSTDRWTIPLCHEHHIYGVEKVGAQREIKWFADRGIQSLELATALWNVRGNVKAMVAIVMANKAPHGER